MDTRSIGSALCLLLALFLSEIICAAGGLQASVIEAIQPALSTQAVAKLQRWRREIVSIQSDLQRRGVKVLQDAGNVRGYEQRLAALREKVDGLTTLDDVEVAQTLTVLAETKTLLQTVQAEALQQLAELGNYQQRLAQIAEEIGTLSEVKALIWPFTVRQAEEFVQNISAKKQQAASMLQDLRAIKNKAFLPLQSKVTDGNIVYGRQDIDRFIYAAGKKLQHDLHAILTKTGHDIERAARQQVDNLAWYNYLSPEKPADQYSYFLGRGARERTLKTFAAKHEMLTAAKAFYRALQQEPPIDLDSLLKAVENTRHGYEIKYQYALDIARMPSSIDDAAELENIARDALATVPTDDRTVKRIVVISPKTRLEKTESTAGMGKTAALPADVWKYEWDEFKVVSAEQIDGNCYLYYNTIRKYKKGGPTTVLDRWIVSDRSEHNMILAANITK